jgi:hypothetical protein
MNGGPADLKIEYGDGGSPETLIDITEHVIEYNGMAVSSLVEMVRPYGQAWDKKLPVGVASVEDITLGGLQDDAADGPDDLFFQRPFPETPASPTRTFKTTWFGTKTTEVQTFLAKRANVPSLDGVLRYSVTLSATGEAAEA